MLLCVCDTVCVCVCVCDMCACIDWREVLHNLNLKYVKYGSKYQLNLPSHILFKGQQMIENKNENLKIENVLLYFILPIVNEIIQLMIQSTCRFQQSPIFAQKFIHS